MLLRCAAPPCSVDGPGLLALRDGQLKRDLGVLPLGHRNAILKAVKELVDGAPPLEGGVAPGKASKGAWGQGADGQSGW
eukprot:156905-Chlamydomonas_euryale.AAC.3